MFKAGDKVKIIHKYSSYVGCEGIVDRITTHNRYRVTFFYYNRYHTIDYPISWIKLVLRPGEQLQFSFMSDTYEKDA